MISDASCSVIVRQHPDHWELMVLLTAPPPAKGEGMYIMYMGLEGVRYLYLRNFLNC